LLELSFVKDEVPGKPEHQVVVKSITTLKNPGVGQYCVAAALQSLAYSVKEITDVSGVELPIVAERKCQRDGTQAHSSGLPAMLPDSSQQPLAGLGSALFFGERRTCSGLFDKFSEPGR